MQLRKAVQVPKKNHVYTQRDMWENGSFHSTDGTKVGGTDVTRLRTFKHVEVKPNNNYNFTFHTDFDVAVLQYNKNQLLQVDWWSIRGNFTTQPSTNRINFVFRRKDGGNLYPSDLDIIRPMLIQGSQPQPFEPYQLVLPRAKRLQEWAYVKLDGGVDWRHLNNGTGFKTVNLPSATIPNALPNSHIVTKVNRETLTVSTVNDMADKTRLFDTGYLWITVSNADTGFTDDMTPTSQQWRDFFNANPYHLVYKLAQPRYVTEFPPYPSVFKEYEPKLPRAVKVPKNLLSLNPSDWEQGTYLGADGSPAHVTTSIRYTKFIEIPKDQVVKFKSLIIDSFSIHFYDENKNWITNITVQGRESTINTITNAKFMRVRITISNGITLSDLARTQPTLWHETTLPPRLPQRYQPIYDLPFTFERDTEAIRKDGAKVARNQPRVENGIRVEEGTENLWALGGHPKTFTLNASWRHFVFDVPNLSQVTFSFFADKVGELRVNSHNANTVVIDDITKRHTVTLPTNATGTISIYSSDLITIREIQLEQKPYATTFTDSRRGAESLILPNAIPAEEGIIEFEVDFTDRPPVGSTWTPLFMSANGTAHVTFLRLSGGQIRAWVGGVYSDSGNLQWEDKAYTFRIEYTKTHVKLWRDNVLVIDSAISPSSFTRSTMHVGMDNNKQRQTDLTFRNLVITDTKTGEKKKWI